MKRDIVVKRMRMIAQQCTDDAATYRTRFYCLSITAACLAVILLIGVANNTADGDDAMALVCGLAATFAGIHGTWSCVAGRRAHNTFMRMRQRALDEATVWERLSK